MDSTWTFAMIEVLSLLDSGILRITINRPEQRNALNHHVLAGLRRSIRDAGSDRSIRVVTLTGAGDRAFCAGADLKSAAGPDASFSPGEYRELLLDLLQCPIPTVALAKGHVLAGGMGILLSCDLALACDDVHFSTPEIQVGMFPMMVLALLCRQVGLRRSTEMLFLGERVDASAALQFGIVNRIYPRGRFDAEAEQYVRKLWDKSPGILRLGKEALLRTAWQSLPGRLEYLESMLARVMSTEDSKEGIRAFIEKRKPRWADE